MSVKSKISLLPIFDDSNTYEIGVDECARGPLFGRLYVAAVVLPKNNYFEHHRMKDSKKIKSRKKMLELSNYIKSNSIAYHIHFIEPDVVDKINICQAVFRGMRECIKNVLSKIDPNGKETLIVVDGNDFTPFTLFDASSDTIHCVDHVTVEKGDGKYSFIAAASILAKNAHDEYIDQLCIEYPILDTRYSLSTNVGYGTKKHLEGISLHGITQWHRKTYGCCKTANYSPV